MKEFYTVGHSTRKIEEFISLLKASRIELLVDVRAFPVSTRNPQFNKKNLKTYLSQNGIEYIWLGRELGGYRSKSDGLGELSPNKGWKAEGDINLSSERVLIHSDVTMDMIFYRSNWPKINATVYFSIVSFSLSRSAENNTNILFNFGHKVEIASDFVYIGQSEYFSLSLIQMSADDEA